MIKVLFGHHVKARANFHLSFLKSPLDVFVFLFNGDWLLIQLVTKECRLVQ